MRQRPQETLLQLGELFPAFNDEWAEEIENAVATCFLEHMRQARINRVLAPYLSRMAQDKARP